jgi:6-phosphofructokinase
MSAKAMVYLQSGGPTAVINCSLYGAVIEAKKHPEIGGIYGSLNGIEGLINDDLIDFRPKRIETIELFKQTPGALLGTTRFKMPADLRRRTLPQSLRYRESPQYRLHLRQWRQRLDGHLR